MTTTNHCSDCDCEITSGIHRCAWCRELARKGLKLAGSVAIKDHKRIKKVKLSIRSGRGRNREWEDVNGWSS